MRPRFTQATLRKMSTMRKRGCSFREVGEQFSVSGQLVRTYLVRGGFHNPDVCPQTGKPPKLAVAEAAYTAGLFDGEGSVGLYGFYRGSSNLMLRVTISQSGLRGRTVLRWMQRLFGGCLSRKEESVSRSSIYLWQAWSDDAMLFLECVLPYLRLKEHDARLAYVLESRKLQGEDRQELYGEWIAKKESNRFRRGRSRKEISLV